jgi:hypothetical protein
MDLRELFPNTWKYQPLLDERGCVAEDVRVYITRMQKSCLPNWPDEPLKEWLHRHGGHDLETYSSLDFGRFRFTKETWKLADIPGREAFREEDFCDTFQNVEVRAAENLHDWLAHFMLAQGTWNTPIIILDNWAAQKFPDGEELRAPYQLLEGHRRLSFLQGLKRLNKALAQHSVWVVRLS